jgi:hypothetical protein
MKFYDVRVLDVTKDELAELEEWLAQRGHFYETERV